MLSDLCNVAVTRRVITVTMSVCDETGRDRHGSGPGGWGGLGYYHTGAGGNCPGHLTAGWTSPAGSRAGAHESRDCLTDRRVSR